MKFGEIKITKSISSLSVLLSLVAGLGVSLTACESTNSDDVKTPSVYAEFSVSSRDDNRSECTAKFTVGGSLGTYLELNAGDEVTCDGKRMNKIVTGLNQIYYSVFLDNQPGEFVQVMFRRPGEGPYLTYIRILEDFSPWVEGTANGVIHKNSPLRVGWSPSSVSSSMDVTFSASSPQYPGFRYESVSRQDYAPEQGYLDLGIPANATTHGGPTQGMWRGRLEFRRRSTFSMPSGLNGAAYASRTKTLHVDVVD